MCGDVLCAPAVGKVNGEVVEINDDVEGETEVEPLKIAPSPMKPDAAVVAEHRITHIPYRSWCRECVEGRALGEQRGHARDARPSMIPVVGMDYFFVTARGVFHKKEEAKAAEKIANEEDFVRARREGKVVKCLILRCSVTKLMFVHAVPVKGIDEDGHVVKLVCDDVSWIGHTRVILK